MSTFQPLVLQEYSQYLFCQEESAPLPLMLSSDIHLKYLKIHTWRQFQDKSQLNISIFCNIPSLTVFILSSNYLKLIAQCLAR